MQLDDILTFFEHMHYEGMFASAEAYSLALNRVAEEVRPFYIHRGLTSFAFYQHTKITSFYTPFLWYLLQAIFQAYFLQPRASKVFVSDNYLKC